MAIQFKRTNTAGQPLPAWAEAGQPHVNFADETVVIADGAGSWVELVSKTAFDSQVTNTVETSDIVDDLTTGGSSSVLSAEQGKVLKGFVDNLNTLVTSNDLTLDTLQEVVDFIKLNKTTLDALGIGNIAGLQTALDSKANAADVSVLPTYTVTNALTVRTFDADNVTLDRIADVVATLTADISGGLKWDKWDKGDAGETYDDTALTALVNTKADQADTYTKAEVDAAVWSAGGKAVSTDFIAGEDLTIGDALCNVETLDNRYDISNATYTSKFIATGDNYTYWLTFSADGTEMYAIWNANDRIYQYSLSTAWDISTYSAFNYFSVGSQDSVPYWVSFNNDGTKMYMTWGTTDSIYEYNLTTAWDATTASYSNNSFSVSSQDVSPFWISFNTDGTKMFLIWNSTSNVFEYNLTTWFDITTATYSNNFFSVSTQESSPNSVKFNNDGTLMFIVWNNNDQVHKYTLSTAWDITTTTYTNEYFAIGSQDLNPYWIAFGANGTKMFMVWVSTDRIYEYDCWEYVQWWILKTDASDSAKTGFLGFAAETVTSGNSVNVDVDGITETNTGLVPFNDYYLEKVFNNYSISDITHTWDKSNMIVSSINYFYWLTISNDWEYMYLLSNENNRVYQAPLSTPFDITSSDGTTVGSFVISSTPTWIFMTEDGTKFFVVDYTETVYAYSMSTPYMVSTATQIATFAATNGSSKYWITFSSDWTKMYLTDASKNILQWTLSTAWDITSATYVWAILTTWGNFNCVINNDGTKFITRENNNINEYILSTPYDITTATINITDTTTETWYGLCIWDNWKKLYTIDYVNANVKQYDVFSESSTPWAISTSNTSGVKVGKSLKTNELLINS